MMWWGTDLWMLKHSFCSDGTASQDGSPDSMRSKELPEGLLECYDLLCEGGSALSVTNSVGELFTGLKP